MTLDQIKLYSEACSKSIKREAWLNTMNVLAGSRADEKGLNRYQRDLGV